MISAFLPLWRARWIGKELTTSEFDKVNIWLCQSLHIIPCSSLSKQGWTISHVGVWYRLQRQRWWWSWAATTLLLRTSLVDFECLCKATGGDGISIEAVHRITQSAFFVCYTHPFDLQITLNTPFYNHPVNLHKTQYSILARHSS
jgi:hypothetical protein